MLPRDPLRRELACLGLAIASPIGFAFLTVSVLALLQGRLNPTQYDFAAETVMTVHGLLGMCCSTGAGLLLPVSDGERVKSALIWGGLSIFVWGFGLLVAFGTLGALLGISLPRLT